MDKEALQLELAECYSQLAEIAHRQRQLTAEREEVEANRNVILIELGRISLGTNHDI